MAKSNGILEAYAKARRKFGREPYDLWIANGIHLFLFVNPEKYKDRYEFIVDDVNEYNDDEISVDGILKFLVDEGYLDGIENPELDFLELIPK